MKVENSHSEQTANPQRASDPPDPGKAARFRQLLDKRERATKDGEAKHKRTDRKGEDHEEGTGKTDQDGLTSRKKQEEGIIAPAAPQAPAPEVRPVTLEKVEVARAVIPAHVVENLVREITVITQADRQDVNIQFNSQTLNGLQIQISKENGNVSLQFVTSSSEVEKVLQRNMDQLTQSLTQHGVSLKSTRIERVSAPSGEPTGNRHSGQKRQGRQR